MSRSSWSSGVVVAVVTFALFVAFPVPAVPHSASTYFLVTYGSGDLPNITYRFTQSVPNTTFRGRVEDGADKWTAVGGVDLNLVRGSLTADNFAYANCNKGPTGVATVHYKDIGGPFAYGVTIVCLKNNGNIREFRIALNSDVYGWNITTSDPGSSEVDVWSVSAHEFGHGVGGWLDASSGQHFSNNTVCPVNSSGGLFASWQTMCDSVDNLTPPDDEYAKKFRRTLEEHDIHTFENAY